MFQQCIFLILERLKGDKSFYKPYLDILPDAETLFSLDLTTPIGPDFPEITLMDELRAVDNEIIEWAADDKARFDQARQRFSEYLDEHFPVIQFALARIDVELNSANQIVDLFKWASMAVTTRCFGHVEMPNDRTMCPLIDMVNHSNAYSKTSFYLTPGSLWSKMQQLWTNKSIEAECDL